MSPTKKRTKALAGGVAGAALLLALGVAAVAHVAETGPTGLAASVARASDVAGAADPGAPSSQAPAVAEASTDTTPPTTAAPAAPAAKSTVPPTTVTTRGAPAPSTAAAQSAAPAVSAPTPSPTAAPAKSAPGQRLGFTSAGVQAAMVALQQRIPLFSPSDPQLRTFADAVCTSFDQGQTLAQVQATVRQAVSYIQGASLAEADAAFAVRTVVQLRCPGYLP